MKTKLIAVSNLAILVSYKIIVSHQHRSIHQNEQQDVKNRDCVAILKKEGEKYVTSNR